MLMSTHPRLNTALLVFIAAGVVGLGVRQSAIDTRVAAVEDRLSQAPTQGPANRPARHPRTAQDLAAGQPTTDPAVQAAELDDMMWSDEGRAAIDDVVAEREHADALRKRAQWRKMKEFQTERAVNQVADDYDLTNDQVDGIMGALTDFMDAQTVMWTAMQAGPDVDMTPLSEELEAKGAEIEARLIRIAGQEVFDALHGR